MLRRATLWTALLLTVLALMCFLAYESDQGRLREIAHEVTKDKSTPEARAIALMEWVYRNKGFAKNQGYFIWKKLGPTSIDVLESGGDCADKSRLLSSMLRELEMPSTLAMCFDEHGQPTHTIVDAEVRPGVFMLLDPVWGLHFPKEEPGRYYSLIDLRRDPSILWRRLDQVTASAPPDDKIHKYNRAKDVYDRATTINWEKNDLLRALKDRLAATRGDAVYAVPRPVAMEEPKLFFALVLAIVALFTVAAYGALSWLSRSKLERRSAVPAAAKARLG
jgi:hypothetical protein